ncbi:bone morphogenetic protein 2 isoform X1 [Sinocyclocheilus rhinocerous]|uniref:bone morphogenetic protein 2 isoform X1 n=2 Tax=Sinocyclocheilus rhinocerous TaxID=307959 RepID=UPI0007B8EC11|nr:PREDICTED: bone morphogenetic protein 2-like isoform X1 [Sinocyclocheilus rhinocerous]
MRFSASFLCFLLGLLGLGGTHGLLLMEDQGEELEDRDLSKAILEMLHINKLSVLQQAKPHPYMKHVYQSLDAQARDLSGADGTLVQSFRSIEDSKYGTPGWIWFNMSQLSPFMRVAELVLLRKTLHHKPLSVTVTVHSLSPGPDNLSISGPLAEHLLSLDRLPPSGYDVFDVTAAITQSPRHSDILGFQLRFGDESGSLVLHEALTQSLYCLNSSSLSQPLLVVYRTASMEHQQRASGASSDSEHRLRPSCMASSEYDRQRIQLRHLAACKLYVHHVNLHTSKLSQWILQPSNFNISICRGICLKEISASSMSVQRHRKHHGENYVQRSNCSPQGLSSLIVMYSSDTADIIIKELKDIRAERCVCQPTAR